MSTPLFPRNGVFIIPNNSNSGSGSANLTIGCGPTGSTAGATPPAEPTLHKHPKTKGRDTTNPLL